jgi:hypothetical protein
MKKAILLLTFLLSVLYSQAQTNEKASDNKTSNKEETVINLRMIEKFNNAEYSAEEISFSDIFSNYSFDNIKIIAQAYHKGELDISSTQAIDNYLASIKNDPDYNKSLELYSEKKELASKN